MLEVGTKAPAFTLPDKEGNLVSLSDFLGKKVVLYFYPKDNTPGCTRQACAFAGAYSVDKYSRLGGGGIWFPSEQPDDTIKSYVERQLDKAGWRVDCVFSHAAPEQYEPRWAFLPGLDQSMVDKSTERWLDSIEKRLHYDRWFCGHYHVDSQEGPVRILFEEYVEF